MAGDLLRRKSSISDSSDYRLVCRRAASDDAAFAVFKRNPVYNGILEHVSEAQGAAYLEKIMADYPWLEEHFPKFKENDLYGGPVTYPYHPYGDFSPTTLRYVKVLGDLVTLFGSLQTMDLVEIGPGYGGLCKTIAAYCGCRSYTLVDLEPSLKLAKKYLDKHGIENARYETAGQLAVGAACDLVISNYAFCECSREVQEDYFAKVLSGARRGYLTFNVITPRAFRSFSREELLERLPGSRVLPEEPLTHADNFLVVWGD